MANKKSKEIQLIRKLLYNKRNNQLHLTISRKELGLKKGQRPKKIKLDFKGFKW